MGSRHSCFFRLSLTAVQDYTGGKSGILYARIPMQMSMFYRLSVHSFPLLVSIRPRRGPNRDLCFPTVDGVSKITSQWLIIVRPLRIKQQWEWIMICGTLGRTKVPGLIWVDDGTNCNNAEQDHFDTERQAHLAAGASFMQLHSCTPIRSSLKLPAYHTAKRVRCREVGGAQTWVAPPLLGLGLYSVPEPEMVRLPHTALSSDYCISNNLLSFTILGLLIIMHFQ